MENDIIATIEDMVAKTKATLSSQDAVNYAEAAEHLSDTLYMLKTIERGV